MTLTPATLPHAAAIAARGVTLVADYIRVRQQSLKLAAPLSAEDMQVQSMPDASPAKWHLAHTTWFFETFVLAEIPGYPVFDPAYPYLFNSYYDAQGPRHAREKRGLLTRPGVEQILAYRRAVDAAMQQAIPALSPALQDRVELGLHHEMQHQELLLTDILHAFAENPTDPVYAPGPPPAAEDAATQWLAHQGGIVAIGAPATGFAFDNERPAHRVLLSPFRISNRLVSNRQWRDFIADGGYRTPSLWLADGWARRQAEDWQAPSYWRDDDGEMTLHGRQALADHAPVAHISYYEADAFARWAGHRLPTEFEWEALAQTPAIDGEDDDSLTPRRHGWFGSVWQWTSSAYAPYPKFRPLAGAVGEYNGKFMVNQMVLKGSACVTPQRHSRTSYRNFFYPHQRWIFAGLRLATDD